MNDGREAELKCSFSDAISDSDNAGVGSSPSGRVSAAEKVDGEREGAGRGPSSVDVDGPASGDDRDSRDQSMSSDMVSGRRTKSLKYTLHHTSFATFCNCSCLACLNKRSRLCSTVVVTSAQTGYSYTHVHYTALRHHRCAQDSLCRRLLAAHLLVARNGGRRLAVPSLGPVAHRRLGDLTLPIPVLDILPCQPSYTSEGCDRLTAVV